MKRERERVGGLSEFMTYGRAVTLAISPRAAVVAMPTGLLEQGVSRLVVEGLRLGTEGQQGPRMDRDLGDPTADQCTCCISTTHTHTV